MEIFSNGNLKLRLVLLILLAITPAFTLYTFSSWRQMKVQEEGVRDAALKLVRVMKAGHTQKNDDAKGVPKAMSQFPSSRQRGPRRCELLRTELSQKFPGYTNMGIANLDGNVVCVTGYGPKSNVAGLPFLRTPCSGAMSGLDRSQAQSYRGLPGRRGNAGAGCGDLVRQADMGGCVGGCVV